MEMTVVLGGDPKRLVGQDVIGYWIFFWAMRSDHFYHNVFYDGWMHVLFQIIFFKFDVACICFHLRFDPWTMVNIMFKLIHLKLKIGSKYAIINMASLGFSCKL